MTRTRMEWQPIATAPKKGQVLLAARRHSPWFSEEWEFGIGEYLATRWPFLGAGQPTHWMPLPEPPA
jgi:hypothetical protein